MSSIYLLSLIVAFGRGGAASLLARFQPRRHFHLTRAGYTSRAAWGIESSPTAAAVASSSAPAASLGIILRRRARGWQFEVLAVVQRLSNSTAKFGYISM
jgi:hypothetical protein